jgi:hypothetical protein
MSVFVPIPSAALWKYPFRIWCTCHSAPGSTGRLPSEEARSLRQSDDRVFKDLGILQLSTACCSESGSDGCRTSPPIDFSRLTRTLSFSSSSGRTVFRSSIGHCFFRKQYHATSKKTAVSHELNQQWYAVVMSDPANQEGIRSWRQALEGNKLSPEQIEVLQDMVTNGEAETLLAAAVMLDWKDGIIHPAEHLYGF